MQDDEQKQARPSPAKRAFTSGIVPFIGLLCLVVLVCIVQSILDLPHASSSAVQQTTMPLQAPGGTDLPDLQLPIGQTLFYEQPGGIYMVSTSDGKPQKLNTPNYRYNRATPPIVISARQLIYGGKGIWQLDPLSGQAVELVPQPAHQAITSFTVSRDGRMLAWSSEPGDGAGEARVYAGPLQKTVQIYTSSATHCPCLRAFAFAHNGDTTLLLTDDRGDHRTTGFGLWSFDLSAGLNARPRIVLDDAPLQVPLALTPDGNSLLYSTFAGTVPFSKTGGLPTDITSFNYANDMLLASLDKTNQRLGTPQVILPTQNNPSLPFDGYHWVNTPRFSSDGNALVYVQFSSASHVPFSRYNAVYTAPVHSQVLANPNRSQAKLLATATTGYIELGCWLNSTIVSFYAGGSLYALDIHSGAIAKIVQTYAYAHSFAVEPTTNEQ
jgi:hypothetical protein